MIEVRPEEQRDISAVRDLNDAAFGDIAEGSIVDALREACPDAISLVAVDGGQVVGHIFFSPVTVEGTEICGMGLAPMAVLPERQGQGIGSKLVHAGIDTVRAQGWPFLIVLGHPEFYTRFGFEPASRRGLRCQWEGVPDEAFMVLVFDEDAMVGVSGVASYRVEFDAAMG